MFEFSLFLPLHSHPYIWDCYTSPFPNPFSKVTLQVRVRLEELILRSLAGACASSNFVCVWVTKINMILRNFPVIFYFQLIFTSSFRFWEKQMSWNINIWVCGLIIQVHNLLLCYNLDDPKVLSNDADSIYETHNFR